MLGLPRISVKMRNSADKAVTPRRSFLLVPARAWALKTPRSQAWPWFPHHRILCGLRLLLKSTPRPPALHPFPELAGRQKGAMPKAACADACVFIYVISHSRDHKLTIRPSLPFPTGSLFYERKIVKQIQCVDSCQLKTECLGQGRSLGHRTSC